MRFVATKVQKFVQIFFSPVAISAVWKSRIGKVTFSLRSKHNLSIDVFKFFTLYEHAESSVLKPFWSTNGRKIESQERIMRSKLFLIDQSSTFSLLIGFSFELAFSYKFVEIISELRLKPRPKLDNEGTFLQVLVRN